MAVSDPSTETAAAPPPAKAGQPHLYLVDGSGYIFRAYHALPPMSRPDGTPVNAVFGFSSMLVRLIDDLDADHLAVIFDASRLTSRNDIYPEYKPQRPEAPEDRPIISNPPAARPAAPPRADTPPRASRSLSVP